MSVNETAYTLTNGMLIQNADDILIFCMVVTMINKLTNLS